MKKLSIQNLNLDSTDLLQRDQLKTIYGGVDEDPFADHICKGKSCSEGNTVNCGSQCICDMGQGKCRLH